MPTGMMTLNDVVDAGIQGQQWAQQQEAYKRAKQMQQIQDEANKAAGNVIDQSKAEWAMAGAQGQYRPSDATMLKAAEARGMTLAKGGDWQGFMQNEAQVQGHRMRVRAGALRQYEMDGDPIKLATAVYPTIFDGKEIVGTELVRTGPEDDAGPTKLKLKLSDGSTQEIEPPRLVQDIRRSLIDPMQAAQQEVELNFLRAKEQVKTEGSQAVERTKGEEARKTATVRGEQTLAAVDRRNEGALERTDLRGQYGVEQTEIRADASRDNARTRAGAAISVAELRKGGRASGGGGSTGNNVQSRFVNDRGEVVLVMRNGEHRPLVGDDGRPVKSIDYQKLVQKTAGDIGKTEFGNTPEQNRDKAKRVLTLGDAPGPSTAPAAGAKDYSKLWK